MLRHETLKTIARCTGTAALLYAKEHTTSTARNANRSRPPRQLLHLPSSYINKSDDGWRQHIFVEQMPLLLSKQCHWCNDPYVDVSIYKICTPCTLEQYTELWGLKTECELYGGGESKELRIQFRSHYALVLLAHSISTDTTDNTRQPRNYWICEWTTVNSKQTINSSGLYNQLEFLHTVEPTFNYPSIGMYWWTSSHCHWYILRQTLLVATNLH